MKNFFKMVWKALKTAFLNFKSDFSKETLKDFIIRNYYVHLIIGSAFAIQVSYLLLHGYKGEGISPYVLIPMHAGITFLACRGLGMLIEMVQGSDGILESAVDVRFTSYGFAPGSAIALMFYLMGWHNWTMLVIPLVMYAIAYLLWKYNR